MALRVAKSSSDSAKNPHHESCDDNQQRDKHRVRDQAHYVSKITNESSGAYAPTRVRREIPLMLEQPSSSTD